MIIISLYESDYPIIHEQEPDWLALPIGYFTCERARLRNIENRSTILSGDFTFCERPDSFRPNSGDHLLAVFAYNQVRYLYQSTISYEITDIQRRKIWWSHLGFSKLIRKW